MRPLTALLLAACLARGLAAQEPLGPPVAVDGAVDPLGFRSLDNGLALRVDRRDGLPHASLWLTLDGGAAHDPADAAGLAQVLATACADRVAGDERIVSATALGDAVWLGVTLPAPALPALLATVAALLGPDAPVSFDDAALVRARDRALLRADDEAHVLPGPMLRRSAAARLDPRAESRPPGGEPEQLAQLTPERIRAALAARLAPQRAACVIVGAGAELADLARAALGAVARRAVPPLGTVAPAAAAPAPAGAAAMPTHPLLDAPFMVAAVPAPAFGEDGYLPFLIGMEVARVRAARVLGTVRGGELRAELPPLWWDPTRGERFAFLERRGQDGDEVGRVEAELRSLVAGLRDGGPTVPEIQSALGALLNELRPLAELDDRTAALLAGHPALLHARARLPLVYRRLGWPADLRRALGEVTVAQVQAALRQFLAADRVGYVALLPEPR
ncbi:MAG: hypothetical protein IPM29_19960 [Planctomycetes bacterium]|nr:hypothetical protein [Planctomycetota bacterium]